MMTTVSHLAICYHTKMYLSQGGIVSEFEIDVYTLLCLKWITNKDLLHITGNAAQC